MIHFLFQNGESPIQHWVTRFITYLVFVRIESNKNVFMIVCCWYFWWTPLLFHNLYTDSSIINTNAIIYADRSKPHGRLMRKTVKIAMNKFIDCYFFGLTTGLNCEGIIFENPNITIGTISFEVFWSWFRRTRVASTLCFRKMYIIVIIIMCRTKMIANNWSDSTVLIFTKSRHYICPKDLKVGTSLEYTYCCRFKM